MDNVDTKTLFNAHQIDCFLVAFKSSVFWKALFNCFAFDNILSVLFCISPIYSKILPSFYHLSTYSLGSDELSKELTKLRIQKNTFWRLQKKLNGKIINNCLLHRKFSTFLDGHIVFITGIWSKIEQHMNKNIKYLFIHSNKWTETSEIIK